MNDFTMITPDDAVKPQRVTRQETGHAIAYVDYGMLEDLFQVPAGVRIDGIYISESMRALVVHLSGDELPKCAMGAIPARANVTAEIAIFGEHNWGDTEMLRLRIDMPK